MEAANLARDEAFSVDLKHALIWVARALDYVGIDDVHHGHRVAYIAYEVAKEMGWDKQKQEFCFLAGLLHDCGVSRSEEHLALVSEMSPSISERHCIAGYHALRQCSLLSRFANIVLYHHSPWSELIHFELPTFEKEVCALIFLADRLDFIRASHLADVDSHLITLKKDQMAAELAQHKGSLFNPVFVDALVKRTAKDGFWYSMVPEHIENLPHQFQALDWLQVHLSLNSLIELARFIALIVDAKSPFTYQHSLKVAHLAERLATKLHLPSKTCKMLYVAGLVHDIGKLRTPDAILHKQGSLSQAEYAHIKKHTVDTEIALYMVFPNSKIGEWAANHHERLNGSGYPYNKKGNELDLPSRIIAVADVFQALSQDRPYRGKMSKQQIQTIMQPMIDKHLLDKHVYLCLCQHLDECYALSTSQEQINEVADIHC
ncbi:HD-GYP domain-containing protein [Motilimonas eburnea]|uniref:HD-GYP domain-containing protein n=1 Tax=Motilimonas eburnea TaxID=1737488 RepID=UPI001E396FE6|nr:HD domain-containing phosphohydrolase [Motilimonas eburnea]MCE2570910.1 HD domain-containing protein [Motilimonas eburnea]